MFFLLKSEKWAPYRDYCNEVHGRKLMTFVYGLLTVLMMPNLFWIIRRGENAIQFWFNVRTFAKFPSKGAKNGQTHHFLESIVVIPQQFQIPIYPKGLKQKTKLFLGWILSKIYFFTVLFFWVYGMDQIWSNGFRCRNLKNAAEFLLNNDTKPADYWNMTFTQVDKNMYDFLKDVVNF